MYFKHDFFKHWFVYVLFLTVKSKSYFLVINNINLIQVWNYSINSWIPKTLEMDYRYESDDFHKSLEPMVIINDDLSQEVS